MQMNKINYHNLQMEPKFNWASKIPAASEQSMTGWARTSFSEVQMKLK